MLKRIKSLSSKTLCMLAAAAALAGGIASVGAQAIVEDLDINNPLETTYNRVFYKGATATKIGDVLAHTNFQGGDLAVTMTKPDVYAWNYQNVCVFSSPPSKGKASQSG